MPANTGVVTQPFERRQFLGFPRQPGAHVDRLHARRPCLGCREHGAVKSSGKEEPRVCVLDQVLKPEARARKSGG